MSPDQAIETLGALAQTHRLAAFRALVAAAPDGLAAGDLAKRLGIAPAALSFHLSTLTAAGLVRSERRGRRIVYSAVLTAMRGLIEHLTEDCCGGHPEICVGDDAVGSRRKGASA
jgi:ArsR family transcriptional regulator